ncbi:MAG: hypothetical protein P8184_15450 [Calditrichia bacterium]
MKTTILLAGDGNHSQVHRLLGSKSQWQEQKIDGIRAYVTNGNFEPTAYLLYDRICTAGYFWIFPISGKRTNIGLMVDITCRKNGMIIKKMFFYLLGENVNIKSILSGIELPIQPRRHPVLAGNRGANVCFYAGLLIGDAAAFNNPLTCAESIAPRCAVRKQRRSIFGH